MARKLFNERANRDWLRRLAQQKHPNWTAAGIASWKSKSGKCFHTHINNPPLQKQILEASEKCDRDESAGILTIRRREWHWGFLKHIPELKNNAFQDAASWVAQNRVRGAKSPRQYLIALRFYAFLLGQCREMQACLRSFRLAALNRGKTYNAKN